jgi:2'-5' RNA ligase
METTYILTAEMDDDSFAWLDGLRRRHFPPERNFLPAHLTLFRLSSAQVARLRSIDLPSAPVELRFDHVVFLGSSVALRVRSTELEGLRSEARTAVGDELSRQDSQPWKPHVTIQNKTSGDVARQLYRALDSSFAQRAAPLRDCSFGNTSAALGSSLIA